MSHRDEVGQRVVIGLDAGTSSVKAVAFRLEDGRAGAELAAAQQEVPSMTSSVTGRHEQDPRELLLASRSALASVVDSLDRAGVDLRRVGAIGLTTAMHGLLGFGPDGSPCTPLVTWADGRATEVAVQLRTERSSADLHAATGTPIHPMSPLAKLRWYAEEEPAAASTVRTWGGSKELLVADLTGEIAVDESSASATGLWSLRERRWHPAAMEAARVDEASLAPVLATTDARPLSSGMATATGLRPGVPVVLGAGDGPCANLGVGANDPTTAALSIGTSAALRVTVTEPTIGDGSLFCYVLDGKRFVVGGALSTGGSVLDWAAATFGAPLDIARRGDAPPHDEVIRALVEEAAAVTPGSDGLVVVPRLYPERAPTWDPTLTGSIIGLDAHHGRGHLVRAAVEGVAVQLAEVLGSIEAATGPVREVRATGGALAHGLWREVTARALGLDLTVHDDVHGTARGAAALAVAHLVGGDG